MKKVAVIGTLVWDRIWHPVGGGEQPTEQWGGIAYSLAAFSAACPPGWRVAPILRVGADLADEAERFLRSLPNLELADGITIAAEPNNRVELRYHDEVERTERLTGGVSGWSWEELVPHLIGCDAAYVNFISGFEIDLETAAAMSGLDIPLYADLHSLFLGPPSDGIRMPRRPVDWRRWVAAFDIVQLNEPELLLTGNGLESPDSLLSALPPLGPVLCLLTRGGKGAAYVRRSHTGDDAVSANRPGVRRWANQLFQAAGVATTGVVAGQSGPLPGDPTGCGDVWGSVAFAGLLRQAPLEEALRQANTAAAAKLGVGDIEGLSQAIRTALGADGVER